MKITRDNYEAWFLDYAEGELNEAQIAELNEFLDQHPDLREEFEEDFSDVVLEADEDVQFHAKSDLKRELEVGFVTVANVEYYLIAEIEGQLTSAEKSALEAFLAQNAQFKADQSLYAKTRLEPDMSIQFKDKRSLKRSATVIRSLYVRYAAAAAVLLLFFFAGWQMVKPGDEEELRPIAEVKSFREAYPEFFEEPVNEEPEVEMAAEEAGKDEKIADPVFNEEKEIKDLQTPQVAVKAAQPDRNKQEPKKEIEPRKKSKEVQPETLAAQTPVSSTPLPKDSVQEVTIAAEQPAQPEEVAAGDKKQEQKTVTLASNEPNENNLADYAGRKIKRKVLAQENVTDGTIRENDVVGGITNGVGKVVNGLKFEDKSNNDRISYGISIGKVGFSRSTGRK